MPIDTEFLEMLACPACRGELVPRGEERLFCTGCRRSYPVRDEIPILLVDEAILEDGPAGPSASDSPGVGA